MVFLRRFAPLLLALLISGVASADSEEGGELKQWQEAEVQLPAAPRSETLQPFYVSAVSDNQFMIDLATLSIGTDGVIRYVLLIITPGGGRNVTFEGMRCETREHRMYASGRQDGSWSRSRNNDWSRIREVYANRHHATLFMEYFCPSGISVASVAEAKNALQRGEHPSNKRNW